MRRRQQLKKRRDYRGNNSFMGVHALAGTTGRRDREANAARVEALPALTAVMKESSKAARRAMDRGKPPSMPADVERGSQSKVRGPRFDAHGTHAVGKNKERGAALIKCTLLSFLGAGAP